MDKVWRPEEVLQEEIQDFEREMVVIGCDVESLYPNLDVEECGRIVEEEIMRTKITWEDLDYLEGCRMIALNRSAAYCRRHPLHRVLPVRRRKTGCRPGVTGNGPLGKERGDQEQWRFPLVTLTGEEKKMIIAEVVKIATEVMFENHLYTFGGRVYRQGRGGPIGLRGTCAIARLVMCYWDKTWKEMMRLNRIELDLYMRYMDDGRAFLAPIKPGWRWVEGGLRFTRRWREEDETLGGVEITRRVLHQSMQEVIPSLSFTTEVGEGEGNWLATLDTEIRVEESNLISYRQYEKPTTTNTVLMKRSALEENSKVQILANELARRLGNTDERQDSIVVGGVVDKFCQKLLTSGYSPTQTRKITLCGIRGWERRKIRARTERGKLFRTSEYSRSGRIKKKTTGKNNWFRKKRKSTKSTKSQSKEESNKAATGGGIKYKESATGGKKEVLSCNTQDKQDSSKEEIRTAAVMFVENTKEGGLVRKLRKVIERVKGILGYSVKIVERAGTPLKLMFPLTKIGQGGECGKDDCVTCTQESRKEILPPCNKRSVVYENICTKCNPGVMEGEEKQLVSS